MTARRDTGFHPAAPDYTEGRAIALATADARARADIARATHKVALKQGDEDNRRTTCT